MSIAKVAFLIGSGVSKDSHAPMSAQITESLLNDGWFQHQLDGVRFSKAKPGDRHPVIREQAFLRILRDQISDTVRARERRPPNYEDIYACLMHIQQFGSGYNVNPLVADAVARLRDASQHIHATMQEASNDQFQFLVAKAADLVEWVVYHALVAVTKPVGLDLIAQTAHVIGHVDVFTLNHDLLVERLFAQTGIPYSDGFGASTSGVSPFTEDWLVGSAHACRIFKLHGSIDWWLERANDTWRCVKLLGDPHDVGYLREGTDVSPLPAVLIGTAEKELRYGTDVTGHVFRAAHDALQEHYVLICSGYGWRDNGINKRILEWLHLRKQNRIVLLHNESMSDGLSRTYFWWSHKDFLQPRVHHIRRWLSQVDFPCIEAYL
jgi:hypothetical protein